MSKLNKENKLTFTLDEVIEIISEPHKKRMQDVVELMWPEGKKEYLSSEISKIHTIVENALSSVSYSVYHISTMLDIEIGVILNVVHLIYSDRLIGMSDVDILSDYRVKIEEVVDIIDVLKGECGD